MHVRPAGSDGVTAEMLNRLISPIASLELNSIDRIGILNDAFALSRAGLIPLPQVLTLAAAYQNEQEYSVWTDLAENLEKGGWRAATTM